MFQNVLLTLESCSAMPFDPSNVEETKMEEYLHFLFQLASARLTRVQFMPAKTCEPFSACACQMPK